MKDVYLIFEISRQAHQQALLREQELENKQIVYIGLMLEVRGMHPGMGLRKMYNQFRPEGIGRDAFIALGLSEGLRLRSISNPMRTTYSIKSNRYRNLLKGKRFTDVNQVWVSDLFYFSIQGKHYYVVLIMDLYSRRILGYSAADNMRAENNIKALRMALNLRGIDDYQDQLIHHSDRGSQYVSDAYTDLLGDFGIQVSMCIDVLENSHMERVNGTIKNEYLNGRNVSTFRQLKRWLRADVEAYNNRLHNSLGKTPNEYEAELQEIPKSKREVLRVFTMKQNQANDPRQLSLFNQV